MKVDLPRIAGISFFLIGISSLNSLIDFGIGGGASTLFCFVLFFCIGVFVCFLFRLLTKLCSGCFYFGSVFELFSYRTLLFRFSCHDNQPPLSVFAVFVIFSWLTKIPWIGILGRPMLDYNRGRRSCILNCYQLSLCVLSIFTCHCIWACCSYSLNPLGCCRLLVHTCQSKKIPQFRRVHA